MGKRRNNLIILALVLALLGVSIYVITSKATVLGLDLRGGTELVYQGRPSPQVPDVTPEDIDRAIEIIRERVDTLGVSEPEISRVGTGPDRRSACRTSPTPTARPSRSGPPPSSSSTTSSPT